MSTALSQCNIALSYIYISFFFLLGKQYYRTAFNFLTAAHDQRDARQSPPVISTTRQFRVLENRTCESRTGVRMWHYLATPTPVVVPSSSRDSTVTCSEAHVRSISTLSELPDGDNAARHDVSISRLFAPARTPNIILVMHLTLNIISMRY